MNKLAAIAAVAIALGACGGSGGPDDTRVFAAASLTDAFAEIAGVYENVYGRAVSTHFAGSRQLVEQLRAGADADVLATADERTMDAALAAGVASDPVRFASNALAIVVADGNPEGVRSLSDLARSDLVVVIAADEVPAGQYARRALARAGVDLQPASLEPNVRAVVTRVALGEADAGLAYVTDGAVPGVDIVKLPEGETVVASYFAAVVTGADRDAARRFLAVLVSERGQRILEEDGFERVVAPR